MMNNLMDWLCQARKAKRMALIAHVSPDGDTVGATLALRLAFLSLGKAVDVICDGEASKSLSYLPGIDAFMMPEQTSGLYDTVIAVDVSDHRLLGRADAIFDHAPVKMVIDHHATNPGYGDYNYIRGDECSCCVLAYDAILAMGVELTRDMGTCLMTGMSTDTGHFMYPYTTPHAFEVAGKLLALGVDVSYITRVLYPNDTTTAGKLLRPADKEGKILSHSFSLPCRRFCCECAALPRREYRRRPRRGFPHGADRGARRDRGAS